MGESEHAIQNLKSLSIEALQVAWKQQLGTAPPRIRSADVLGRLLAWKIQEREQGGLASAIKCRLRRLARESTAVSDKTRRERRKTTPGTVLSREWKGAMHYVAVTGTGYEYAGKCYRSLSEVARTITGTRWSGPLFFGLKSGSKKKAKL